MTADYRPPNCRLITGFLQLSCWNIYFYLKSSHMKSEYHLDHEDYMSYLQFSTTLSKKVQKRRALNKLVLMIVIVATGFLLYSRNGPFASGLFFLLCLPLYFFYGVFEKKQFNRHFKRFINDHFKGTLGKPSSIELLDASFHVIDDEDNIYAYSDIEEIRETESLIIIQLKKGLAILLPKNKLQNVSAFIELLNREIVEHNIPFHRQLDWKWK